jgi:AcrR family transcriptional regulator
MTRQYLLDAAAIVFARDGFHGATLDDIAALAGFSKGAVYSNFKSKDDLFLALLDDRTERQYAITLEVLEAGPNEEQEARIRDLLGAAYGPLMGEADTLMTLYLEFVLYARRNPEAREKLVASARRERARMAELIQHQYEVSGAPLPYPLGALAAWTRRPSIS